MTAMMSKTKKQISFRCIDFQCSTFKDQDNFFIRMYGIDENRNTYCVHIDDFKPFFYIKVGENWDETDVSQFIKHLKEKHKQTNFALYKTLCDDIESTELVEQKTLYQFDNHKKHKFILFKCHNMNPFYKIKPLYYDREKQRLLKGGYEYNDTKTELYETMIPPMLRFFHIRNISPSGWVCIDTYKTIGEKMKMTNTISGLELNITPVT